jgi:hypothetical protein
MASWDGSGHAGVPIQVAAVWYDTGNNLVTGLSPTIDIIADLSGSLLVDGAAMIESTAMPGWYYYNYTPANAGILKCHCVSTYGSSISVWNIGSGAIPDMASATAMQTIDDNVDAIKADTDAYLDAAVSSRLANADYTAPDNAGITAISGKIDTVDGVVDSILARTDVATSTRLASANYIAPDNAGIATIDTVVDAIKLKTDLIPADPADVSDLSGLAIETSMQSAISKIDIIDGIADSILAKTDVATSTRLASANYTAPDNSGIAVVYGIVDEIKDKTDLLPADPAGVSDLADLATGAELAAIETKIDNIAGHAAFIAGIEGGRWKIDDNQMIFYADDNATEIARFDLLDKTGDPAEQNIFERRRV